jgi:hypothetical protein
MTLLLLGVSDIINVGVIVNNLSKYGSTHRKEIFRGEGSFS